MGRSPRMAPYASKLLMVRGIRSMNEWSFEGTLGQKNDPHTNPCGSTFTCFPLTPNSTTSSASNPGKFDAKPTGRSLDHIAAVASTRPQRHAGVGHEPGASPSSCRSAACRAARSTQSVISWSDDKGTIFPGTGTASTVYSSLTGLFGTGTVNPDTYAVARGKSVIDCVRDDLDRLSEHQHERRRQAEAEDVDRSAPLRGWHGLRRRHVQHGHRATARSDGDA